MKYPFEQQAMQNKPMPDGLTTYEKQIYIVLRNLYYALNKGSITQRQAQKEKNSILKELDDLNAKREFERKLWENAYNRTFALDRAVSMYRKNRSLECADRICDGFEWLHDECALPVKDSKCPICESQFSPDGATQKPNYCGMCGCLLKWEVNNGN